MNNGVFFLVENDQLQSFATSEELGEDVLSALQSDLGVAVGEDVLPIAHWEHDRTGPLSIALNFNGELVILISAEKFRDQASLLSTLSALEQWLAPMDLRDLGELSGNPTKFYQGLWDLSPNAPLTLASMLRILLINPAVAIDQTAAEATLPFCRLEILQIETLRTSEGGLAIRKEHRRTDTIPTGEPLVEEISLESRSPVIELDATTTPDIDLTLDGGASTEAYAIDKGTSSTQRVQDPTPLSGSPLSPLLLRGCSYAVSEVPLRFDSTGDSIIPLSDQQFISGNHLVLVVAIDDEDEIPLDAGPSVQWASSKAERYLFEQHRRDPSGSDRTIHVFAEVQSPTPQPSDRLFYLGEVSAITTSSEASDAPLLFELQRPLESHHLRNLRVDQLAASAAAPTSKWVPDL